MFILQIIGSSWMEIFPGFVLFRQMAAHSDKCAHLTFFNNLIVLEYLKVW